MNLLARPAPDRTGAPARPPDRLPTRIGLGLKPEHFRQINGTLPDLGFFEIHAENYMVGGPSSASRRERGMAVQG